MARPLVMRAELPTTSSTKPKKPRRKQSATWRKLQRTRAKAGKKRIARIRPNHTSRPKTGTDGTYSSKAMRGALEEVRRQHRRRSRSRPMNLAAYHQLHVLPRPVARRAHQGAEQGFGMRDQLTGGLGAKLCPTAQKNEEFGRF